MSRRSMYATEAPPTEKSPQDRLSRRWRETARTETTFEGRPRLILHRWPFRASVLESSAYARACAAVREELQPLEAWAQARTEIERTSAQSVRTALELLKAWGRFVQCAPLLDGCHRPDIVTWLSLEHRWCYAAAGTDRSSFDRATGRTGAR